MSLNAYAEPVLKVTCEPTGQAEVRFTLAWERGQIGFSLSILDWNNLVRRWRRGKALDLAPHVRLWRGVGGRWWLQQAHRLHMTPEGILAPAMKELPGGGRRATPRRKAPTTFDLGLARAMREGGISFPEIGRALGVTSQVVLRRLRAEGK